jgi:flagellar assembly protein FliH
MISQYDLGVSTSAARVVSDLLSRVERPVSRMHFFPIEALDTKPVEIPVARVERPPEDTGAAAAEALRKQVAQARIDAFTEARRTFDVEMEGRLVEERKKLDRVRLEFARDRQRFFAAAESQVVKLALAIARKVLTREVESDGMHLRATVKSALARVQDGSATVLRVAENETEAWAGMFKRGTAGKVEVVGDARLRAGDCVLETSLGRIELGVEAQMEEVERGFGELMHQQGQ